MRRTAILLILALGTSHAAFASGAGEHLLSGARAFRAGQFRKALVEFRVAEKLGAGPAAAWYAAASLVKLHRAEDAVEAFAKVARRNPRGRDELFDYYHAVACSDARLYFCAKRLLSRVGDGAGPHIRDEAKRLLHAIDATLAKRPSKATIDWYRKRAARAARSRRPELAAAYLAEARHLEAQRRHPPAKSVAAEESHR